MYSLGIDQGGTKTVAIVADDEGQILGKGVGEGSCHFFDGMPKAMAAVETAADAALAQAGLSRSDIRAVSAGMAGANWPEEIVALEVGLRNFRFAGDARVYNDCLIALRGGTAKRHCAVICAGTGLNVAVRLDQHSSRVFNNYIEDLDQGARGLGARALRAVYLSEIGALPATSLTETVLALFELDSVDKLLLADQRAQLRRPIQNLSPFILEAAAEADAVALEIIQQFAQSIARYPAAAIKKHGAQNEEIDVVLSGGLFKAKCDLLLETVGAEIHGVAPNAKVFQAMYEPVVGAVLLVLDRKYRDDIPAEVMKNCHASAEKLDLLRVKSKKEEK